MEVDTAVITSSDLVEDVQGGSMEAEMDTGRPNFPEITAVDAEVSTHHISERVLPACLVVVFVLGMWSGAMVWNSAHAHVPMVSGPLEGGRGGQPPSE
jgi:hypothetical protein